MDGHYPPKQDFLKPASGFSLRSRLFGSDSGRAARHQMPFGDPTSGVAIGGTSA
jgi:hypothetical protein